MMNKLDTGKRAEHLACQFLQEKGLKFLQQNYRCHHGEIDLIMQDREDIVFVEVRSRNHMEYGSALESISQSKIKKLIRTATHYLQRTNCLYKVTSRFDIIAIDLINGALHPEWIKNAFETL